MSQIEDEAKALREKLRETDEVEVRVALFGQPGSGKSSIINALIGKNVAPVGVETDKTIVEQPVRWNGLVLVDLPGYDTANFPKSTYFRDFNILSFDLFLFVLSGKARASDTEFLRSLREKGKVCIYVRHQCDAILDSTKQKSTEELRAGIVADIRKQAADPSAEVIFTSITGEGLAKLQDTIEKNLGDAKAERWARSAKAYSLKFLEEKREACGKLVTIYAGVSAANGINPIPGLDAGIDIALLLKLFREIRDAYGLDRITLLEAAKFAPLQPFVRDIVVYATREGLLLLLKRFAGRELTKTVAKYIPIVGQAIAAALGFAITKFAGDHYNDQCYAVAKAYLEGVVEEDARDRRASAPGVSGAARPNEEDMVGALAAMEAES